MAAAMCVAAASAVPGGGPSKDSPRVPAGGSVLPVPSPRPSMPILPLRVLPTPKSLGLPAVRRGPQRQPCACTTSSNWPPLVLLLHHLVPCWQLLQNACPWRQRCSGSWPCRHIVLRLTCCSFMHSSADRPASSCCRCKWQPTIAYTLTLPHMFVPLCSPPHSQLLQAAVAADSSPEAPKLALWSGRVKHRFGSSTVELFHMTALLPEKNQEQFPPTLFVTELATQRDVKLGEHYVMRCRLDVLSEKQVGAVLRCLCCCLGGTGGVDLLNTWKCASGSLDMLCKEEERAGVELVVLPAVELLIVNSSLDTCRKGRG